MRKRLILILLTGTLFLGTNAWAQVKIAKVLSSSSINQHESSHLVLIDFWATWCVPCINIGKQLEITQATFKDDLTIISLTNESAPVVREFIDTHHPKLTIALDFQNQTFSYFKVNRFLPYSVLLNQKGQVLWEGHPANLSSDMIRTFVERCRNLSKHATRFIELIEEETVQEEPDETDRFSVTRSSSQASYFIVSADGVRFSGKSSKLFSELLRTPQHSIVVKDDPFIQVDVGGHNWSMGPEIVLQRVLRALDMSREIRIEETTYYSLSVTNPERLWDEAQITLADYNGAFLIGSESISVDNASVADFAFRLSAVMDHPVYTDYESPILHDWLVHHRFLDMTKEQLENEYGVRMELTTGTHRLQYFK